MNDLEILGKINIPSLKDGDVLFLALPESFGEQFTQFLAKHTDKQIAVVFVADIHEPIKHLSEADMNQAGWYRK